MLRSSIIFVRTSLTLQLDSKFRRRRRRRRKGEDVRSNSSRHSMCSRDYLYLFFVFKKKYVFSRSISTTLFVSNYRFICIQFAFLYTCTYFTNSGANLANHIREGYPIILRKKILVARLGNYNKCK